LLKEAENVQRSTPNIQRSMKQSRRKRRLTILYPPLCPQIRT